MAVFSPLINLVVNFGIVLLLWISGNAKSGEIGRLMASINYMTQVLFAVTMISNTMHTAVRAAASSDRIRGICLRIWLQEAMARRGQWGMAEEATPMVGKARDKRREKVAELQATRCVRF